ncbi:MAG: APC family permease [Candidatus Sulfotelmatobacter sp.]
MSLGGNISLNAAGAEVQAHSKVLRKELGIADLALAQILIVIVPEFFGTAVKAGPSHVVLWLLAILLFFVPQALVVAHLNRLMPLEGGLYEWARLAFSDRVGFLVAWNMWLNTTVQVSQIALVTTTYLNYAFGPQAAWVASNPRALLAASIALIAGMMVVARLGLSVGKWVSNAGSVFTVLILGMLVALPHFHLRQAGTPHYQPLPLVRPALTLFTFSVFSKMTFGALTGFEIVAIFAGESRSPGRNLARSILFTAPVIGLMYILGTSSILAYVSPDAIDVIGPIPQALSVALGGSGVAGILVPMVILLLLTNYLCSYTLYFSTNTRLPLVAGWDHLLPRWFTVLHPRYRTPVNSILFMGGIALAASTAVLIGAGNQEAFVLLQIWSWTFYGLAYLAMFAIPLFAAKEKGIRPGTWLRAGAASGMLVTLLFVALSVLPIVDVESKWAYSLKIVLVVLGANFVGWMIYRAGQRKTATR